MSFTSELLEGVAQYLHDAGAGVYRAGGGYLAGEVAIWFRNMPDAPDRGIALATYDLGDDYTQPDSAIGMQVRIRGTEDPFVDQDIDDAVFDALHGLWAVDLGGIKVVTVERISGTSLGPDQSGRFERVSSYRFETYRPSTNRT